MSTQGKTARNRPISKVKIAKQRRRRRGVRAERAPLEDSGVEADEAGSGIRDMRKARLVEGWGQECPAALDSPSKPDSGPGHGFRFGPARS